MKSRTNKESAPVTFVTNAKKYMLYMYVADCRTELSFVVSVRNPRYNEGLSKFLRGVNYGKRCRKMG